MQAAPTSRSGFCLVICFQKTRNLISSSTELVPLESKQCLFTSVFPGFLLIFFFFFLVILLFLPFQETVTSVSDGNFFPPKPLSSFQIHVFLPLCGQVRTCPLVGKVTSHGLIPLQVFIQLWQVNFIFASPSLPTKGLQFNCEQVLL